MRKREQRKRLTGAAALLGVSMLTTEGMLLWQGRWQEAIPLHLCSVSAILAFFAALGARGHALDFLWYLGLPGALLALIFPAPAISSYQALFDAAYMVTHAMIVIIPLFLMHRGAWPRPERTRYMMLALQGLAFAAFAVNHALGTDFLFLSSPPAGTPLEAVYRLGAPLYYLALEGMMLALCLAQSRLLLAMKQKK